MPRLPGLRLLRERRLLSQVDLARASGVAQSSISHIESGQAAHNATVRKLAIALAVAPRDLMGDAPNGEQVPQPAVGSERQAVLVANLLDQAERARARGDAEGVARFETMAAHAAASSDSVD